jgi:hypothetical protein
VLKEGNGVIEIFAVIFTATISNPKRIRFSSPV